MMLSFSTHHQSSALFCTEGLHHFRHCTAFHLVQHCWTGQRGLDVQGANRFAVLQYELLLPADPRGWLFVVEGSIVSL